MKEKNKKKYYIYVLLFILIISLTFYTIFYRHDIKNIIENISKIDNIYIFYFSILFILYFILQGIYMKDNLKLLNEDISLLKGIYYSIVEFFFSGITPSSTGGQPIQLYYMNKDGIPNKKSIITLLINTIYFKLVIVLFGIFIIFFNPKFIYNESFIFTIFFFIGIIVDFIIIVIGYSILFHQNLATNILTFIEKVIKKFKKKYNMKINKIIKEYNYEVTNISKKKFRLFIEFLITFAQRLCMFSMSYIVYKSFGLNVYNFFEIIIIQISVQIAIEFVPLPGGTGISEFLYKVFFITTFGLELSATAMLITRTFTFYIPLSLSGVIILIRFLHDKHKDKLKMLK